MKHKIIIGFNIESDDRIKSNNGLTQIGNKSGLKFYSNQPLIN